MKWSDGSPLTTEDVRFWFEDIMLNDELTPQFPLKWAPGDEPMVLIVEDDYAFRLRFAVPFPIVIDYLQASTFWAPKQYMKQFHITYNPEANDLAKSEGFEYWWEAYQSHSAGGSNEIDPDVPRLDAWTFESADPEGNRVYVRNPFYWVVDPQGSQLPYMDYFDRVVVGSKDVLTAKVLAGDGHFASWYLSLDNFPIYKEHEQEGNYTVGLYNDVRTSEFSWAFNYTHQDPVLREIFNDLRFRRAMSHAVNRDEMKELLFAGLGTPRGCMPDPECTFYDPELAEMHIEYDTELSNQLLDDMGLEWDGQQDWRLRPDGKPLSIVAKFDAGKASQAEGVELLQGYWETVGVQLLIKPMERTLMFQQAQANENDMGIWAAGGRTEAYSRQKEPIGYRPPWHWPVNAKGGPEWRNWFDSNGKEGVEPPEIVKELWATIDEWLQEPRGTERYLELGYEMLRINAENIWDNCTVGLIPRVGIVSNMLHNAPEPGMTLAVDYALWARYAPETWWLEA
jgi:peptide/nickel transport system substrate-binding protein